MGTIQVSRSWLPPCPLIVVQGRPETAFHLHGRSIPAARMKAKRDHRVPLSGRALAILHDVQRLSDGTSLVFRSLRGKPLSNMTLSKLIKELGIPAVPYGFRSSFRNWAADWMQATASKASGAWPRSG